MAVDHCDQFVTVLKLALICLGVRTATIKYFQFLPKPLFSDAGKSVAVDHAHTDTVLRLNLLPHC